MFIYQLTLENLQTGKRIDLSVKADDIDQAHYLAICRYGNDIALLNAREINYEKEKTESLPGTY